MYKQPKITAEFKDLIPPLSPEEYAQLEENILTHGCRDPITLWRGKIIDGHNRYAICTKHEIPFETAELRLPSKDAVKLWILDNQLGRRNLTDAMRIELATRKVELMGQKEHILQHIAKAANLSKRTIQRYMRIKNHGGEELLSKLLSGEYKIGTLHRRMESGMEIIITTREDMPFVPPITEESNLHCCKLIINSTRRIEGLFMLLIENRGYYEGLTGNMLARVGACLGRVERLVG